MSDSFDGSGHVIIQPGDSRIPIVLRLRAATASTNNDGSLPFGSTVKKAIPTFHSASGTATTKFNPVVTYSSNRVTTQISYSSLLTAGLYHGTWTITASVGGSTVNPMVRQYDLNRIYVRNL